jgi:predicted acylesterase/phospholipase RssA
VASAAIPGFYQSVYITLDGTMETPRQMHVDGGLKFTVPLAPQMFGNQDKKRNIVFVVNGYLEKPNEQKMVKANLANIGSRSVSEMSWSQFELQLANLRLQSKLRNDRLDVIAVPPSYINAAALTEFDAQTSNELFKLGVSVAE